MKRLPLCFLLAFLSLGFVFPADVTFGGEVYALFGLSVPNVDGKEHAWKWTAGECGARFKVDASGGQASAHIEGKLCANSLYEDSDDKVCFDLTEAYCSYDGGWWSVKVGRQIEAWGAADGIAVTDVLCPSDQTSIFTSDYNDSHIGIDAIKLTASSETLSAQVFYIPVFTPAKLPLQNGNPLKKLLISDSPLVADVSEDNLQEPDKEFRNGEFAIRLSAYLPFADVSLYGFYGWDDMPLIQYAMTSPFTLNLSGKYKKMSMFGVDASIPVGAFVLRLEGAVFPRRAVQTSAGSQLMEGEKSYLRRNTFAYLAGVDWMPAGWTITAQYYGDYVSGSIKHLDRKRYVHKATLSISRSFLGDTLTASVEGMAEFNDMSYAVMPSVEYAVSDELKVKLDGNLFFPGPDEKGSLGQYEDLNSIVLRVTYNF